MDRKITSRYSPNMKKLITGAALTVVAVLAGYAIVTSKSDLKQQRISIQSLIVSKVNGGAFEDKLRLRGNIKPKTTIYLDAISGGRVEKKLVEQGEFVTEGQLLVELSNSTLQLDVISREAQITEQLNFLRNTQMTTETNKLNLKRDLIEIENQINKMSRRLKQIKALSKTGLIAKNEVLNLQDDLKYYQKRRELTLERQDTEKLIRKTQITQLEDSAERLESNLGIARNNLNSLLVRAPVSGYLSDLNVAIGESKSQGTRLGQIDLPGEYKLAVEVDEYYLNQIELGMPTDVYLNGEVMRTNISKIDSRVNASRFLVEVDLLSNLKDIKRGQSLDLDLILSSPERNTVLLQKGAFINTTGGHWAFVVNEDGSKAYRRPIKLGKKNGTVYQVLEGLQPNDKVITSSYANFDNAEELILN